MLSNRIRTTAVGFAAALSLAGVSLAPTAAQAQWHTYCVAGHCTTHTNYTIEGSTPCSGINSNYNKAYEALLEAIETKKEQAGKVHPDMSQAEAQAGIEEAEAQVHLAGIAAFEWGCDVAIHPTATSTAKVPVGTVKGQLRKSSSRRVALAVHSRSLSAR